MPTLASVDNLCAIAAQADEDYGKPWSKPPKPALTTRRHVSPRS